MKLKSFLWAAISLLALALSACGKSEDASAPIDITISEENIVQSITINDLPQVRMETNDSCVCGIFGAYANDNTTLWVCTQGGVCKFDLSTGRFLGKVGAIGNGHGEYQMASDVFLWNGQVCVFCFPTKTVSFYSKDTGEFKDKLTFEVKGGDLFPDIFIPLDQSALIGRNCYQGFPNETPEFGILNSQLETVKVFDNLKMVDGFNRYDILKSQGDYAMFVPTCEYGVYRITPESLDLAYRLKIDGKLIPESVKNEGFVKAIQWINRPENSDFSGWILYCKEFDKHLCFTMFYKGQKCLAVYDKEKKVCNLYKLMFDKEHFMPQQTVVYGDDALYLFMDDKENLAQNPIIIRLDYSKIGLK
ncbi:MAG: 6-bladed beta-propeller [Bacteroidales bacterium]|nr:6-bladed beta-propeller [Bacteroidales bacterium]